MRLASKFKGHNRQIERDILNMGHLTPKQHGERLDWILSGRISEPFAVEFLKAQYLHLTLEILLWVEQSLFGRPRPHDVAVGHTVGFAGMGGSGRPRFNVSTAATFAAAATFRDRWRAWEGTAQPQFLKIGNSGTWQQGSSDFLRLLSIPVSRLTLQAARATLRKTGLAFLHAPLLFPKLARVAHIRNVARHPTIFNVLGPFSNRWVAWKIMGVWDERVRRPATELLMLHEPGILVTGRVNEWRVPIDELTPCGENEVTIVSNNAIRVHSFSAQQDLRLPYTMNERQLAPHDDADQEQFVMGLCDGKMKAEQLYMVALNAAMSVFAHASADFSVKQLRDATDHVAMTIRSGAVGDLIKNYIEAIP